MRKIIISFAMIVVLMIPLTAQAAGMRSNTIIPRLSFSGTTANCSVTVMADSTNLVIQQPLQKERHIE